MKMFTVIILSVTILFSMSAADDSAVVPPYLGGLQDFEGSAIVQIQTHYDREDPPPGSPPRRSTCATKEPIIGNASCSEICILRTHKGGSCKGDLCLCVD